MNLHYLPIEEFINNNNSELTKIKFQYLTLLKMLTKVSDMSNDNFINVIKSINNMGCIMIIVNNIQDNFQIVASGTIIIEPKIIRGSSKVGHIEDIVVHENYRSLGISQILLEKLKEFGYEKGCYKVILACEESVQKVYEKSNFIQKGISMSYYFEN